MSVNKKYIKLSEVASMFGVTGQTVRNWVSKKLLNGVTIDGSLYIHVKSLNKMKGSLLEIEEYEQKLKKVKEELRVVEQNYIESIKALRDCVEGNKALVANRITLARFLPVVYQIIRKNYSENDRESQILYMLLNGDDIKSIAEHFDLSHNRILQIVSQEISDLQREAQTYQTIEIERDKLLEEVMTLRINEKSFESISLEFKRMENVKPSILTKKLTEFGLSVRAQHCLSAAGIIYVSDLLEYNPEKLYRIRCMGRKTIEELSDLVSSLGLEFGKSYIVQDDGTVTEAKIIQ